MRPVRQKRLRQLDEIGEDEVFRKYLDLGSTRALTADLFEPMQEGSTDYGRAELYAWLHESDERWARWQRVRETRAHVEADMAYEEGMLATPDNASAQRVKVDTLKWRAGVLNRKDYGPPAAQTVVNNNVQIGMAWLGALRELGPHTPSPTIPRTREVAGQSESGLEQASSPVLPPPSSKEGAA